MLDKRTGLLLKKILEVCAEGTYKIVEEEELLGCFPARLGVDEDALSQMMTYLEEHKYIDIRYAEEGVYCVCVLPEGRMYAENAREARSSALRRRRDTVLLTVVGAFLGAFAGAIIAWVFITFVF